MSLSNYASGLSIEAKTRYLEKLQMFNSDCPYCIPNFMWKHGLDCCPIVPKIAPSDIFIYLVETKSYQNHLEALCAYKGLSSESKKAVKDGWVQEFMAIALPSRVVLMKAKVSPSQAISEGPHKPWAAVSTESCLVICAHCTCAAGLGEVCNHVAGLLQVCMVSSQINEQISCTEELCTWSGTYLKPDVFKRVADMGAICKEKLPKVRVPTKEEISILLCKLTEMPGNPAGILLVTEKSSNFIPAALKITLPKPLGSLFKIDLMGSTLSELIKKSNELYSQISVTLEQQEAISSLTKNQSDSKYWFRYRAYRITASRFKSVLRTSIDKPSLSLIKEIFYPEAFKFVNEATRWGLKKESLALEEFQEKIGRLNEHPGFILSRTGALISTEFPFLAASPDAVFSCPCHGKGVVEIKCPFKFKNALISTAAKTKDFPLTFNKEENRYVMDTEHAYYYQVQLQLFISGYRFAFFVVYTELDLVYITVPYDERFLSASIPKTKKFFLEVIMPELIGGYFYLKSTMQKEVPANAIGNKYLPCYCQLEDPKNLPIVICADNNCKRKKFHESCIKSQTNPPKRITKLWKCDTCKKAARAVAAAAAKAKKNNLPVVPSNSQIQRTALSNITNK